MTKHSKYNCLPTVSTGLLVGITALSGILLSSSHSVAESATATVTVGSACTLTATVGTAHSAEIPAGSSRTDIGSTTLNTICNDAGGFAIYAVGYSNNEYGNNKMLSGSSYEFNTGTGTTASNWNMKLSQVTTGTYATTIDGGFGTSYTAIPSTFTKVAHRDSATDAVGTNPAVGSSISLTYGAYISNTQNAGTYQGKVKFTLVHPATEIPLAPQTTEAGCIRYYPNGSNVEGTMGCQPISASDTSATLLASNFSREGYGFAGWSTTYDYSDSTGFLGPQEEITFTAGQYTGTNPGLSLYARWIKSAGSIQNWSGCSSLASGSVTALTDQRDGETYAVAKLADGNCWMIENLRLENTNSDNTTGALAQGYNASFAGLADPESASLFANAITANTIYSTDGSTEKTISGSNLSYRFPRYSNVNTPTSTSDRPQNPTSNSATNSTSNASMYSYGNYYTWAAAIADTTSYTTDNQSITSTSICPSGWHLPKGGDKSNEANNEFWALVVTGINGGANPASYDSSTTPYYTGTAEAGPVTNALRAYPNNFVYSGSVYSGSVTHRGFRGIYWSSTADFNAKAYYLFLYASNVAPGTNLSYAYYGRSIRCLASGS